MAHFRAGVVAALVAGIAMTALLVWRYDATSTNPEMRAYAAAFDHPQTHAETLIDGMDGQAYGQIAVDPTMAHAVADFGSPADAAYREARPAYGWLTYVASAGGAPARVATVLLVLSVLSVAALAAATGALAGRFGRPPAVGALVALLPGAAITVFAPGGAEPFGCALAIAALTLWFSRRYSAAVALFSLAALTRETLLLFPVMLAGWEIWSRRKRLAARLVIPVAVYAAWVGVVYWRVGALPMGAGEGRLGWPLAGLFDGLAHWSAMSIGVAIGTVALAFVAIVRVRHPALRLILLAHLALALVMGELVWASWKDFSRVLLPVTILGIVVLWPSTERVDGAFVEPFGTDALGDREPDALLEPAIR